MEPLRYFIRILIFFENRILPYTSESYSEKKTQENKNKKEVESIFPLSWR